MPDKFSMDSLNGGGIDNGPKLKLSGTPEKGKDFGYENLL